VTGRAALRTIALGVAVAFVLASVLQLVDRLNLVAQPPNVPDSATLPERVEAFFPYKQSIWPVFFLGNAAFGVGFLLIVGLGHLLAGRVAVGDVRRSLVLWTFLSAGVIGAVAQALLLGAVRATIDIAYCDCGFKNEEIVSQVWAQMVAEGASTMILYTAAIMAAAALIVAARTFAGRGMPVTWGWLSYATAALLVINVVLGFVDVGEVADWLQLVSAGVLVPVWAAWVGLRFDDGAGAAAAA